MASKKGISLRSDELATSGYIYGSPTLQGELDAKCQSIYDKRRGAGKQVAELGLGTINNRAAEATHVAH